MILLIFMIVIECIVALMERYRSWDGGATMEMVSNLPVSQFYHVSIDDKEPYNVYGGLQDNGSWYGPL
jgi:hypothetical protein